MLVLWLNYRDMISSCVSFFDFPPKGSRSLNDRSMIKEVGVQRQVEGLLRSSRLTMGRRRKTIYILLGIFIYQ